MGIGAHPVFCFQFLQTSSPIFRTKIAFLLFLAREHNHKKIHPDHSGFPLSCFTHTNSHHTILPSQLLSSRSAVKSSRGTSDTKLFSWSSASWFLCNLFSGMLGCSWIFIFEVCYVPTYPQNERERKKKRCFRRQRRKKTAAVTAAVSSHL